MRDVIITLVVLGAIPLILSRPYIGVLVWSWLAYMNPHRLSWGFAYNMPFSLITAAALFISLLFNKEPKKFPVTTITVIWGVFILWMSMTTLFALIPESVFDEFKRMIKIQVVVFLTLLLINNKDRIIQLVWVIVISIGFFGVKGGIFAVATGGGQRVWGPPETFIEGNNEIALALLMIMPLMWFLKLQSKNKWIGRGLLVAMLLSTLASLASYSRGAFLAGAAMAFMFWLKSSKKVVIGVVVVLVAASALSFMPDKWFDRMNTINTYEEDESALGRINAWYFAVNLANDRPFTGGGFGAFDKELFNIYAPVPEDFHDAHSIYFEVLGEHGYIGLLLFLSLWFITFFTCGSVMRSTKQNEQLKWAHDLCAMLQVCLVSYGVGGAFLGLAYFDLPYHFMALTVVVKCYVDSQLNQMDDKTVPSMAKRPSLIQEEAIIDRVNSVKETDSKTQKKPEVKSRPKIGY